MVERLVASEIQAGRIKSLFQKMVRRVTPAAKKWLGRLKRTLTPEGLAVMASIIGGGSLLAHHWTVATIARYAEKMGIELEGEALTSLLHAIEEAIHLAEHSVHFLASEQRVAGKEQPGVPDGTGPAPGGAPGSGGGQGEQPPAGDGQKPPAGGGSRPGGGRPGGGRPGPGGGRGRGRRRGPGFMPILRHVRGILPRVPVCVCPVCGHRIYKNVRGLPCKKIGCPECGNKMVKPVIVKGSDAMDRQKIAKQLVALAEELVGDERTAFRRRQAIVNAGPVADVLEPMWNKLHDMEYDLEQASQEYDVAASYAGKPGERDAKQIMAAIKDTLRQLEALTSKKFGELVRLEQAFVKEHGRPDDYAERMSREMFSN